MILAIGHFFPSLLHALFFLFFLFFRPFFSSLIDIAHLLEYYGIMDGF